MSLWATKGLFTGIKTTRYPAKADPAQGITPGRPVSSPSGKEVGRFDCPTNAIYPSTEGIMVDFRRCVHCFRCALETETPIDWQYDYEWAKRVSNEPADWRTEGNAFKHSISVLVVDGGDCGACLSELKQLSKPYYNFHRLGYFVTPTPRHADVILVVGPVTDNMRAPLLRAYEGIPAPRKVVAVGACALTGGVFGPSFVSEAGVASIIPVDVEVPGCPPPPMAILHALNLVTGKAQNPPGVEFSQKEKIHVGE
jgi:Ni,Fe-hydrogenase III small subunit/ferredoxin-like protein FixX